MIAACASYRNSSSDIEEDVRVEPTAWSFVPTFHRPTISLLSYVVSEAGSDQRQSCLLGNYGGVAN